MAIVSRDPFARQEVHKRREYGNSTCLWCGNQKHTPNGRKYLYQYSVESDGGRKSDVPGLFDSVSCMRTYHGG